jgi:hypothetical protein
MNLKYILKIFIIVFLILSLIVFINSIGLNLNAPSSKKQLLKVYTMEGFEDNSIIMNKNDAFCESHRGSSGALDESCGKLTQSNCNSTSCCVWTSDNKCMAGGQGGPTFNSDAKGKTKHLDYYYFQNKCYGPKCPN